MQISSNYVLNRLFLCFSTWMAFGGNTRDLGSFGEETDKITNLQEISWKKSIQSLETASEFLAMPSGLCCDDVRVLVMASGSVRLKKP